MRRFGAWWRMAGPLPTISCKCPSSKPFCAVDGEPVHRTAGGGRKDDDYWRDLQLKSLGWQVCRFWVYELREDLPRCVERVVRALRG